MKKTTITIAASALALAALLSTTTTFAQTAPATFSRDLSVGSSGTDVSSLQQILASAGFFSATPTGFFGQVTKAALASWQASKALPATGYFGPLSRAALGAVAVTVPPSTPAGPAPKITNLFPMSTTTGATVTLTGTGFTATGNNVNFGVFRAVSNISSANGTTLTFTVPANGGADCAPNAACPMWATVFQHAPYLLTVKNANGTSNQLTFSIK